MGYVPKSGSGPQVNRAFEFSSSFLKGSQGIQLQKVCNCEEWTHLGVLSQEANRGCGKPQTCPSVSATLWENCQHMFEKRWHVFVEAARFGLFVKGNRTKQENHTVNDSASSQPNSPRATQ